MRLHTRRTHLGKAQSVKCKKVRVIFYTIYSIVVLSIWHPKLTLLGWSSWPPQSIWPCQASGGLDNQGVKGCSLARSILISHDGALCRRPFVLFLEESGLFPAQTNWMEGLVKLFPSLLLQDVLRTLSWQRRYLSLNESSFTPSQFMCHCSSFSTKPAQRVLPYSAPVQVY